jgi:putative ABC transport system permease protein
MRFWSRLLRRAAREANLDRELRFHLEQQISDYVASGVTPEEARRRARLEFGGLDQVKEECRDVGAARFIEELIQDLRYGLRQLRRNPGFTAVAVITLALGIGANTAIFSVVDAVLLRPLPYRHPGRLVMPFESLRGSHINLRHVPYASADFEFLVAHCRSYAGIAAYQERQYELSGAGQPERVTGARVSASLFSVLDIQPVLGRTFNTEEDKDGQQVAVLSYKLWRSRFGGEGNILGKRIDVNRKPYTVIGVMPRNFAFPERGMAFYFGPAALYVPISFTPKELQDYGGTAYDSVAVARLRPGVTLVQAEEEADTLARRIEAQYPPMVRKRLKMSLGAAVSPLREEVVGHVETLLLVLLAAAGLVLLIACVDVASLMLTRAIARHKEMAIRTAMGASHARVIRQLLTESILLGLAGGVLGLIVAFWGTRLIVRLAPGGIPLAQRIGVDGRVLGFTVLLSIVTAVFFGAAPSLEASRINISEDLKEGDRSGTAGRRQRRMLGGFVMAQLALTLILLSGAGLLLRSFVQMLETSPGFQSKHVVSIAVSLPAQAYPSATEIRAFYQQLLARARALPGVQAAALGTALPMEPGERHVFTPQAGSNLHTREPTVLSKVWVLGDYFRVLGIPLKKGRYFSPDDRQGTEPVVIINETMAKRYWPQTGPVGQRFKWGGTWANVVGVVRDLKHGPVSTPPVSEMYSPYLQEPDSHIQRSFQDALRSLSLAVRCKGNPEVLISALRHEVRELDPSLPIYDVQTMDQLIDKTVRPEQFNTVLMGLFAMLALVLAAVGIYGVVSYSVKERTHEVGIRMALGAQSSDALRLVLRQGMILVLIGVGIGIGGALGLTRFLSSLLYGVKATDPLTFIAVSLTLTGVALLACYIPARRAARVDPMVALRHE